MSYGVALRNGVPFTLGTIAALCTNATGSAWSPLALWPDGIDTPGMWISPRTLTSEWQDYTGTTPVATPGTVADSANPVGLALDIRAGATVLTDPGLHMLQSTSAARPLLSARVNQYQYTEDPSNAVWTKTAVTASSVTGPGGASGGIRVVPTAVSGLHTFAVEAGGIFWGAIVPSVPYTLSVTAKAAGLSKISVRANVYNDSGDFYVTVDLANGSVHSSAATTAYSVTDVGNGWWRISVSGVSNSVLGGPVGFLALDDSWQTTFTGNGVDGIDLYGPDFRFGTGEVLTYQSVPGNGSTYASGFPIAQLYDGVDDGMATAAFAAGTLIDGMDCLIAVRRDSAATAMIAGLYKSAGDGSKYFGEAWAGQVWVCFAGVGTPTVWVDNTQLAGGTAVNVDTLSNALTVGDWHILEFRDLDLSAWTALAFGGFGGGYNFNGPRGDILLYPSTASTTDKDAARQWLADYYGVTLP